MKINRLTLLLAITVIYCALLDIYTSITKGNFSHNAFVFGVYPIGFTISAIILLVWYIYEIRLFFKKREEKA